MAARAGTTWTELAHDTRQTLGPVAGTKRSAILGDALDEDFFGGRGDHRVEALGDGGCGKHEDRCAFDYEGLNFILYKTQDKQKPLHEAN